MENLSFIDYLKTKEQLRTALTETPYKVSKYCVTKYCKLELKESSIILALKPNHKLIVEWLYEDINAPTAESVLLMVHDQHSMIDVKMSHAKFTKWVNTNCNKED